MLKLTIAAALIAGAFISPATAASTMMMSKSHCTHASMMKMDKKIDGMQDAAMKDKAMKEMMMAKDSMKMKKMSDCRMHMDNAMKSMM
jgi:hypothetical protein